MITLIFIICLKAFVLFVLLNLGRLMTGGVPVWQKGLVFGGFCIALKLFICFLLAADKNISGTAVISAFVIYSIVIMLISVAYFYGVEKIPGRFNRWFTILAGIPVVVFL